MSSSRRLFIIQSLLAAASVPCSIKGTAQGIPNEPAFPIGIAGYTFYRIDIQSAIRMMQRLGVQHLSLKDIHLPLNSSDEVIKSTIAQFSAAGIQVYAVGVIYMKSKEAVDLAFRYAGQAGVTMIVGVPDYDLLDYC
ncbi:MAG: sugar phosphate isomerase/epimerase, partial [Chitinophagaceae bacterium]|nr:sugar phosphate isomerase/epimerase [Chitinophagaceae bacterium]